MSRIAEAVAPRRLGRSFRWLLGASWVSNLGDGIALAAGPLLVASQTRDPFLVALAVVLQRAAVGALRPPGRRRRRPPRPAADRHRRPRGARRGRSRCSAPRSWPTTSTSPSSSWPRSCSGTAETFTDTTTQTLLPMIVDRGRPRHRQRPAHGGHRSPSTNSSARRWVRRSSRSARWCRSSAQAVCVVLAATLVSRLVLPPHGVAKAERSHVRRDIVEGLRWLWGNAAVRTLALTIVTFNVTYGAAWSVLVLYAIERLDAGEVGFGLLTTAAALGGIFGTGVYGWLSARVSLGNLMRAGLIIETLTHLALALTTELWIALLIMFAFGAHAFVWGTTSTSIRQRTVPTRAAGPRQQRLPHRRAGRHRRRQHPRRRHRRPVGRHCPVLVRVRRLGRPRGRDLAAAGRTSPTTATVQRLPTDRSCAAATGPRCQRGRRGGPGGGSAAAGAAGRRARRWRGRPRPGRPRRPRP